MFVSLSFWCLLVSFPVLGAARPVVVPRSQEVLAGGGAGTGAGYNPRLGPDNANCTREVYSLGNVTSTNIVFEGVDSNANQTFLNSLLQTILLSPTNFSDTHEWATQNVTSTYAISGTLCTPLAGAKNASHVQLLIHGIAFDSSYWDFAASEEYSYVRAAADAGYTTFRYDRLGTGLSEKPADAYNVVQTPTDLAIAIRFTEMLRSGEIGGQKFDKIVGVGHSYGSAQVQAITSHAPTALDAALLQGFSANSSGADLFVVAGAFSIATNIFPDRFSPDEIPNAYLVTGTPEANQLTFFNFPFFSEAAFNLTRDTEQPTTQAVLFTQSAILAPAEEFAGPVHVVTGAQDLPFCFLNCFAVPPGSKYPNIPAFVQELYPATSNFSTFIPADTGHAINQHLSAPSVYQEMLGWIDGVLA